MFLMQSLTALALGLSIVSNPVPQTSLVGVQQVGELVVENTVVLTKGEIAQISGLRRGQIVDDQLLESGIARIRKAYLKMGFIEVRVSIKKEPSPAQSKHPSVDLRIAIEEGPRFLIRRTEVEGNHMTNHNVVMRAAGHLRPNRPYNPDDIETWVRGLNRLGRFQTVKKTDIEITIDKREHFVDVLFHLKEKKGLRLLRG